MIGSRHGEPHHENGPPCPTRRDQLFETSSTWLQNTDTTCNCSTSRLKGGRCNHNKTHHTRYLHYVSSTTQETESSTRQSQRAREVNLVFGNLYQLSLNEIKSAGNHSFVIAHPHLGSEANNLLSVKIRLCQFSEEFVGSTEIRIETLSLLASAKQMPGTCVF